MGSFRNKTGRERCALAYARDSAQLPTLDATFDLPTAFGTVRAYEWNRAGSASPTVLLVPGRSAGAPM